MVHSGFDKPYFSMTADEVFAAGFAAVAEKYIEPATPATLAMNGLGGLAAIDPRLMVSREGSQVLLAYSQAALAKYQMPEEQDAKGWAVLAASLIEDGRQASGSLKAASAENIYKAVFDAMLSKLDAFSRYAGAAAAAKNRANRDGYGGIGVLFNENGNAPRVETVMPKTPAAKAGIMPGDRITHVDNIAMTGKSVNDIDNQLRGPVDSLVRLTVLREAEAKSLSFELRRELIIPGTVAHDFAGGIVTLKVSGFNQNTAQSLSASLKEAKKTHGAEIKGWILDMRGNTGGLLKQSVKVADLFLAHGDIINTWGRNPKSNQHFEASEDDLANGLPLVVAIDGKSASSSEVVAAALQDQGRAVIIGTASYGKGTVQTVIRLPNDGEITLTWSRLIAPSGYALHEIGVLPTICTSGETDGEHFAIYDPDVRNKNAAAFVQWRKAQIDDKSRREELRALCKAERRPEQVEIEVARRLLNDQTLFESALDMSMQAAATPVAAAP